MVNNDSNPTAEEIVSSIKRSFLPLILIEGNDDVFIYRWLKSKIKNDLVSFQTCGGRNTLFSIYKRRFEFSDKQVVFVADKDSYRFETIPEEFNEIIFTNGYCIENDIYEGSDISSFLDEDKINQHDLLRNVIGKWIAFELDRYTSNPDTKKSMMISQHINSVCPAGTQDICPIFAKKIGYNEPSHQSHSMVFSEYNLNVRGKQLFQMLSRFLSGKGRFSNFSDKNLIEIALKQYDNVYLDELVKKIVLKLNEPCDLGKIALS